MQNPNLSLEKSTHYFALAKNDFFAPYLLSLTFLPLLFAFLGFGLVLYFFGMSFYDFLYTFLYIDLSFAQGWLSFLQSLFDYVLKASLFVLFAVIFVGLSLLVSLLICAFIAPFVVRFIQKTHYPQCALNGDSSLAISLLGLAKTYLLYFLYILILLPFCFIPFVGGFVLLLPKYWLFSKTILADVLEEIYPRNELKTIKKTHKNKIRSIVIPLFLLSLIPILGFFTPIYALSVLTHVFLDLKTKESYANPN